MEQKDCIFCQIALGKIPAKVVYQDGEVLAFLDINPSNKGHVLVIPKKHYPDLSDIPEHDFKHFMGVVKRVGEAVIVGTKAEGLNIVQNNGKVAGQVIPHLHYHVIPRFTGDELQLGSWRHLKYDKDEEMDKLRESISANVPAGEIEIPREEPKVEMERPKVKRRSKKEISFVRRELDKA
ncbi:MAG: HIT family protein [Candidatus Aenigmatarchaeota archaeon]